MAEEATIPRSRKRLWISATVGVVLLALFVGLAWYLRSAVFAGVLRGKLITALEDATGGRVEMGSFRWNLSQLAFEADNLTVHGLEPAGELPYAHVDHVLVRLQVTSFLGREFNLARLELQRPIVHLIVNADGITNAPHPKLKTKSGETGVQELFDLAIARADLRDGMVVVNERKLPLDFSATDVIAQMNYVGVDRASHYNGTLQVGKIDLRYGSFREVPASADLQFTLYSYGLNIQRLVLNSRQSKLQASGEITGFRQPRIQLAYSGSIDIAQLGAVLRANDLRGGTLLVNGSGSYSGGDGYSSNGHLALRNVDYAGNGIVLRRANADSNFKLLKQRLTLTRMAAHLLGGEVTGEAEVKNVPASTGQPVNGSARLRAAALSLNELARGISSRSLPLEKLNPAGSVAGTVDASWRDSLANVIADLNLDIVPPAQAAANQLPVSGGVRGRYSARAGRIELAALNLTTPHTQLEASGSLGANSAALKLAVKTSSPSELQPLLASFGNGATPIELHGTASFDGTVSGRLLAPQVSGQVEATDFTYLFTPPAHVSSMPESAKRKGIQPVQTQAPAFAENAAQPRRIHIDRFSGEVQYSQTAIALHHATVNASGAQLTLDGSTALDRGELTDNSEFQAHAALHNGDISELQHAVGLSYPVRGTLSFMLDAAGTIGNPHGRGQISLSQAEVHRYNVKSLNSKLSFANHSAELQDIHLQAAHGTVTGAIAYDFGGREGKLDLTGHSINLVDIHQLQTERLEVAGVADFKVQGSGKLDHPTLSGHVNVANLLLNQEAVGAMSVDAVTEGRQLTLTARSRSPMASLSLDGTVELAGDMPANAVLRFANLEVNPFMPPRLRSQITRGASLNGRAQLSGPLKQPQFLHGSLELQQVAMEVQHIPVRSDGPIQLSFAQETITVQRCTLLSDDTHFVLTGTASVQGDHRLDLHANGSVSLKLAEVFDPELTSYGVSNINLNVAGTATQPAMTGRVEIAHAGLSKIDMPVGFGDMSGTLVFNQDRLEVENLTGRMGGGRVRLGGFVTFSRTLGFNLTADGSDVRFRYAGFSATSDQTLRLTGTLENAALTGNVTVTHFAQAPASDLQLLLSQATAPPSVPNPKSPLNNIRLEIRILSTPELTVETSLAKLSGDVDLRLRGTAARPVLLGRINIAEGDLKLAGTKYHLERGDVTFVNPVRIDPVLDVEATTRVRDYDITIGLHGTMERLNTTYRSDPPLSTDDIISLLAFGRTQTEAALGGSPSSGFSESASGALLSSALNQVVTNRVSKIFGSSSIRINPSLGGPENDPNARLTLEQQVSNNITFTYITNLARSAQEVIQFEYNINREYTLQGVRDENGVVSFDLLIRKRKR